MFLGSGRAAPLAMCSSEPCFPTDLSRIPWKSLFTIPFLTKEIELPYWEVLRRGGCTAAHARQLPGHCCNVPLAFKNNSDSRYDRCRSQTLDELISMGGAGAVACSDSNYDRCRSQTLDESITMVVVQRETVLRHVKISKQLTINAH